MYIILMFIGLAVYVCLPAFLQLILSVLNSFIADPIPLIDEIIMYGSFAYKVKSFLEDPEEYMEKGCLRIFLAGVVVVIVIVAFIVYLLSR